MVSTEDLQNIALGTSKTEVLELHLCGASTISSKMLFLTKKEVIESMAFPTVFFLVNFCSQFKNTFHAKPPSI